jgi:hypothetical protein
LRIASCDGSNCEQRLARLFGMFIHHVCREPNLHGDGLFASTFLKEIHIR